MATTKYKLTYDYQQLAEVEIEENKKTDGLILDMVEFWSDHEHDLEFNGGDLTKTFLQNLTLFIVRNGHAPDDDEGWCDLKGEHGITVRHVFAFDFEREAVEIEVVS